MPIELQWTNPQRTQIVKKFSKQFTLCDWYTSVTTMCLMLNKVQHPVDIILDLTALNAIPVDFVEVLCKSKQRFHANQHRCIAVIQSDKIATLRHLLASSHLSSGIQIVSAMDAIDSHLMLSTDKAS